MSPVGLNGGDGVDLGGGVRSKLTVPVEFERGKKRQDAPKKPGSERYNLTANASQVIQCAPHRFVRLQLVRGLFAGSYDRLESCTATEAEAEALREGMDAAAAHEAGAVAAAAAVADAAQAMVAAAAA